MQRVAFFIFQNNYPFSDTSFERLKWPQTKMLRISDTIFRSSSVTQQTPLLSRSFPRPSLQSSSSERIVLVLEIEKNGTVAIRWIDSHLKTGFVPTMTERFQFVFLPSLKLNEQGNKQTTWLNPLDEAHFATIQASSRSKVNLIRNTRDSHKISG